MVYCRKKFKKDPYNNRKPVNISYEITFLCLSLGYHPVKLFFDLNNKQ